MSGVLLADRVGVSKTAQVMAAITFLQQVELIKQVEEVRNRVDCLPLICELAILTIRCHTKSG